MMERHNTKRNEGKIDRIKRGKIDRKINIRKRNKENGKRSGDCASWRGLTKLMKE